MCSECRPFLPPSNCQLLAGIWSVACSKTAVTLADQTSFILLKSFDLQIINLPLNFFELASLIKKSHLVIANDTGPAHMAAHLGAKGFALFGPHTTPEKVSIEREKFIALQTTDLKSLFADRVYALIKSSILS